MLKAKYNEHPWESIWWKDIKKICGGLSDNKWFDEGVTWKVGNGEKSRFWKDPWLDGQTLENRFPRLFLVLEQKESLISEVGSLKGNTWSWDLTWRR